MKATRSIENMGWDLRKIWQHRYRIRPGPDFNTDFTLSAPNFAPPFFATANRSTTRVGWTAGGGLQYAVTNNWWVFAEYRFSDFGTLRDNNLGSSLPAGAFFNANRRLQENQVQAGFSYKFDTYAPVPVVAKY